MSEKKVYQIGCYTEAGWDIVHELLTRDGTLEDNIPPRSVELVDYKEHSPTRSTYLLSDEEAEELKKRPEIKFVNIDYTSYGDQYKPPAKDLYCDYRYSSNVKSYRNFYSPNQLPASPTSADLNRNGYQLYRCTQKLNPWAGVSDTTVFNDRIQKTGTGLGVDVIVSDDGCWFGHSEFQNNTGSGPTDYIGGNVLPGNGTCDLLDLYLDSPYYIDPDWFNADPATRLITRWDGTIVPVEQVARDWWSNPTKRSAKFAGIGTVPERTAYTRDTCNGSNTFKLGIFAQGTHGTPCSSLAYGRTLGWAYNANKWAVNILGLNSISEESYFDMMKIFHQNKPINPSYGNKNPTISSNSWGYRYAISTFSSFNTYYYRVGTTGSGGINKPTLPGFLYYLGYFDNSRISSEMLDNSISEAGKEMIDSGVIFVAAAGNNNQKIVGSNHPDYNNYWANNQNVPLANATYTDYYDRVYYQTSSRRGYPTQLGKYTNTGSVVYPVIAVGALDGRMYSPNTIEYIANYSMRGESVDLYAPGDGVLAASTWQADSGYTQYNRADTYPGANFTFQDIYFNGTSAACPVTTGLIATALQYNRNWTWQDVKAWINTLELQTESAFYQGPDPNTAESPDWSSFTSLMGGSRRILYNNVTIPTPPVVTNLRIAGSGLRLGGNGLTISL
jgi:hypothetical protein